MSDTSRRWTDRRATVIGLAVAAAALLPASTRSVAQSPRQLRWEYIPGTISLQRAKVPGGWLVVLEQPTTRGGAPIRPGLTFFPDPEHTWDGGSLP